MTYGPYDTWENIYKSLRVKPEELCAKYKEIQGMKSRFLSQFGKLQLELDYKTVTERSRK